MKIYVAHELSDRPLAVPVIQIIRDLGHEVLDPIDLPVGSMNALAGIDLFVAIVSPRANAVFFELGYVAAVRKEILLLARRPDDVASGAASFPYVVIGDDPFLVEDKIKDAVARGLDSRNARAHGLPARDIEAAMSSMLVREKVKDWFEAHGASVRLEVNEGGNWADLVARFPNNEVVVVELRTWPPQGRVSVEPVLQLRRSMPAFGATFGLLLTTGSATPAAQDLATGEGVIVRTVEQFLASGSLDEVAESNRGHSR